MWKCIRCEKENPDSAENCMECGHGKTMNYRDYRTLSKVQGSVIEKWKQEQHSSEYFKKMGVEYLQKTIECFIKSNESNRNIQYMITAELNKYFTVRENKEKPILMADGMRKTVFGSNIRREDICEIEFIRISKDIVPDGAWDISADQNRTIWAWTENAENKMLLLKIGSEDGIYANASCAHLFEGYCNTIKIVFHDLFDTSQVTDMSYMFANCEKLKEVDVDSFDTDKVTNMYAMFSNCKKIERVDVSRFNTSNVANMGLMFAICAKLEKLDVSNFDTRKVTSMKTMFCGCSELKELDVRGFDTHLVTDMSSMFLGCKNLRNLDISNFHFQKEAKTSNMFRYSGMDGIAVGK